MVDHHKSSSQRRHKIPPLLQYVNVSSSNPKSSSTPQIRRYPLHQHTLLAQPYTYTHCHYFFPSPLVSSQPATHYSLTKFISLPPSPPLCSSPKDHSLACPDIPPPRRAWTSVPLRYSAADIFKVSANERCGCRRVLTDLAGGTGLCPMQMQS